MVNKKPRNMNGDGSLYWHKSTNRWVAQLNCQNGKRKYKYHTNKREANALLKQMIRDDKLGDITNNIKVSEYLVNEFLPTKRYKKPSTYNYLSTIINVHLVPHFLDNKMSTLKPDAIKKVWLQMSDEGKSASLINKCHSILASAFNTAIPQIRMTNPCHEVRKKGWVPVVRKKEIVPLTNEEVRTLLSESHSRTEYYPIIRLALATGMRRGELCALTWKDIDWDNTRIKVTKSMYVEPNGNVYIGTTKNDKGRNIHIEPETIEFLKEHRETLKGNGLLYGYKVNLDSHVFLNPLVGSVMQTHPVTRGFSRLAKLIGLKGSRFHDLRHTFASNLLGRNVPPKVVQEILGHQTISVTMDIYGHLMGTAQANALEGFKLPEHT